MICVEFKIDRREEGHGSIQPEGSTDSFQQQYVRKERCRHRRDADGYIWNAVYLSIGKDFDVPA